MKTKRKIFYVTLILSFLFCGLFFRPAQKPLAQEALSKVDVVATESGLMLTFNNTDEAFVYDKIVSLEDVFSLDCQIVPLTEGACEFSTLNIDLVDVSNETNYVRISVINRQPTDGMFRAYVLANANVTGETLTGAEYIGGIANIHKGTWGTSTSIDFNNSSSSRIYVEYNNDQKAVYIADDQVSHMAKVCDLDDKQFFDNLWSGFSSDYAHLRISASGYSNSFSKAQVLLKTVGGKPATIGSDEHSYTMGIDFSDGLVANERELEETLTDNGLTISFNRANDSYTYIKDVASSNGDFDVCLDVQQAISNLDGMQKMYVELIDANSINNVVSICLEAKQSSSGLLSSLNYMAASASLKGVDEYGSSIKASKYLSGNLAQVYLKYYNEEKALYISDVGERNTELIKVTGLKRADGSSWEGFSSGNVYVRLVADTIVGREIPVTIKSINGEKINALGKSFLLPNGVVGKAYNLFEVTPFDELFNKQLNVRKEVKNSKGESVAVNDDSFTPAEAGLYTVYNYVGDNLGNEIVKTYSINIVSENPNYNIVIADIKDVNLGEEFVVPSYYIENGGSVLERNIYIMDESGSVTVLDNNKCVVTKCGNYKFVVELTDRCGQVFKAEKTFKVNVNALPVFEDIILPDMMYKGVEYDVLRPNAYIVDANGDKISVLSYVTVIDENGEYICSGNYTPTGDSEVVTFKYIAREGSVYSVEYRDVVITQAIDELGQLNLVDYFRTEGDVDVSLTNTDIRFAFSQDAEISFNHPVVAKSLSMVFSMEEKYDKLENITILVADANDPNCAISFTYITNVYGAGRTMVKLNGTSKCSYVGGSFVGGTVFNLKLDLTSNKFYNDNDSLANLTITEYLNGEKFNGFPSGLVNVKVLLNGVYGDTVLKVEEFCGQVINSDVKVDIYEPYIIMLDTYGGVYEFNTYFSIPKAAAFDLFTPYIKATMTVQYVGGDIVQDKEGILLKDVDPSKDWQIKFTKYANIRVQIKSIDLNGNESSFTYILWCRDRTAPEITVNSADVISAKVGDKVYVPSYTINDNVSLPENCEVVIYSINTENYYEQVTKDHIIVDTKGVYQFAFIVFDEEQNMTTKLITIVVE